ncbi:hypothetical protein F5887DRAFT_11951 [Amanita rubescens]|nr:hypothetical protein F5887DRAFT_11951 [Amanita rubescens]
MSDGAADCIAACCGACCLCGASSLESWCMTVHWGSCGCSQNAGCCGSCCKNSLNDDNFDEYFRRDMAKTSAANASVVAQQPSKSNEMTTNGNEGSGPTATN